MLEIFINRAYDILKNSDDKDKKIAINFTSNNEKIAGIIVENPRVSFIKYINKNGKEHVELTTKMFIQRILDNIMTVEFETLPF